MKMKTFFFSRESLRWGWEANVVNVSYCSYQGELWSELCYLELVHTFRGSIWDISVASFLKLNVVTSVWLNWHNFPHMPENRTIRHCMQSRTMLLLGINVPHYFDYLSLHKHHCTYFNSCSRPTSRLLQSESDNNEKLALKSELSLSK